MKTAITVYYLEMTDPADLRPKRLPRPEFEINQARIPLPELNRFFYAAVGAPWSWYQRLSWTYRQWQDWVERPSVQTWVAYLSGTPAGYFELHQPDAAVEIAYFGILPRFVGQGLGGHLLTCAIEQGWHNGAQRVWVHTCSLDHPQALANYQARGLRLYKEEVIFEKLPHQPLEPWPGAYADRA